MDIWWIGIVDSVKALCIVSFSKLCTRLWKIITVICVKISSNI